MQTIGQIIKSKRREKKWTQQKLAEKVDVCPATIRNWEESRAFPSAIYCIALAEVFGCTIDELCGVTR